MISLEQVSKTYHQNGRAPVSAVCDASLTIGQKEFVVITGRSGSGKTTLLNLVAGLTRPSSGIVTLQGTDLWRLNDAQQSALRSRNIGFVFQFPSLIPALTVLENVLLPTVFVKAFNRRQAVLQAEQLLNQVGLASKLDAHPRHLSAGQQQRVVIARALMNQPQILLADEPTSNLDEQTEQEIMGLFQTIHASTDMTILMVTHAAQLVPHGTRMIHMTNGSIDKDEIVQERNLVTED